MTAFKTISMRIRGYDEETEELSEDLQNISGDIADLTKTAENSKGISLFTDESKSTYKSTYQLLKEISSIYHDLTDKQQAGLLEKLGGKRGSQVLAGVLDDFSEVERAMGEMENSFGSADREMSIVEESIDFKLNALKETWTGVFQALIDRGTIGGVLDFLTELSEGIEKVTKLTGVSGLGGAIGGIALSTKNSGAFRYDSEKSEMYNVFGLGKNSKIDIDYIEKYNQLIKTAGSENIDLSSILKNTNAATAEQIKAANGAAISVESLGTQANITSIAMKGLAMAGNMLIGLGVGLAINLLVKGIDNLAHSAERAEKSAKQFTETYNDLFEKQRNNAKTISELSSEFDELSEGVDRFGNNLSLTSSEYTRYHEICNQIADITPDLVSGYDKQGNAIIRLRDNVESLNDAYDEQTKREATQLYNQKDESNGGRYVSNVFKDFNNKTSDWNFDGYEAQALTLEDQINAYKELLTKNIDELHEVYNYDTGFNSMVLENAGFTSKTTVDDIKDIRADIEIQLQDLISSADEVTKEVTDVAITYTKSRINEFYDMSDKTQQYFEQIVGNLSLDFVKENMSNEDDMKSFVTSLAKSVKGNEKEFNSVIASILTIDEKDLPIQESQKQINAYISKLQDITGIDLEELKSSLGFDEYDKLFEEYQTTINDSVKTLTGADKKDLEKFFRENSINTQEEIDNWKRITAEIKNAEEAKKAYLAEANLNSFDGDVNVTASLSDLKTAFSGFGSILDDLSNGTTISADSVESLATSLGDIEIDGATDAIQDFRNVITEMPGDIDAQHDALNTLATFYIDQSSLIKNLTDENKEYTKSELEKIGVMNADEVVESRLDHTYVNLRNAQQELNTVIDNCTDSKVKAKLAGIDLTNMTAEEASMLATEATQAGLTSGSLLNLAMQKLNVNNLAIATAGDCMQLAQLMKYSKDATTSLNNLANAKLRVGLNAGKGGAAEAYQQQTRGTQKIVDKELSGDGEKAIVNAAGNTSSKSGGGGGGNSKSSKDSNKTEIDWIARNLERLQKVIDQTKAKFENLFTVDTKASNLEQQITKTTKLLNNNAKAAEKYQKKADNVAKTSTRKVKDKKGNVVYVKNKKGKKVAKKEKILTSGLIKKIQEGKIDGDIKTLIKEYGQTTAEAINKYKEWYDKSQEAKQQVDELTTQVRQLREEQYQLYVDDAEANINRLKAFGDISDNYLKSNDYLEQQKQYIETKYEYEKKIAALTEDQTKIDQLEAERQKELIQLEKEKFDNIKSHYERQVELQQAEEDAINRRAELSEAKGMTVDRKLYKDQIEYEKEKRKLYQQSKAELEEQLATIPVGTAEWYDAKNALSDVNASIDECTKSVVELGTQITTVTESLHKLVKDELSAIVSTMDTISQTWDKFDKFDEDTGAFTREGRATMGTYVTAMNVAVAKQQKDLSVLIKMKDAFDDMKDDFSSEDGMNIEGRIIHSKEELYNKMMELESELNSDIIELTNAQNNAIDMMIQKYEAEAKSLQKIVDLKKQSLSEEKSLYDYQKQIKDASTNISNIQKQLNASVGDTSEAGRMKTQRLRQQLEEANESRDDLEREKYFSDMESMLDKMYDEYYQDLQKEMKDRDKLLKRSLTITNENINGINSTITEYAEKYNYVDALGHLETGIKAMSGAVVDDKMAITVPDELLKNVENKLKSIIQAFDNLDKTNKTNGGNDGNGGQTGSDNTFPTSVQEALNNGTAIVSGNGVISSEAAVRQPTVSDTITLNTQTQALKDSVSKKEAQKMKSEVEAIFGNSNYYAAGKKKKASDYKSKINEELFKNNKKVLTESGLAAMRKVFNTTNDGLYKALIDLTKVVGGIKDVKGFAHGGIGKLTPVGEDGLAWVRNGEGFVAPEDVSAIKDLLNIVPQVNGILKPLAIPNSNLSNLANSQINAEYNFTLENCSNAIDIINCIKTDRSVRQALEDVTINQLNGSGSRLSVNRF